MDQRIATIVMIGRAIAFGEQLRGSGVVAGLIVGETLPAGILEALRGVGRTLCFQQALALLIGAQPEIIELERLGRRWNQQQQRQAE